MCPQWNHIEIQFRDKNNFAMYPDQGIRDTSPITSTMKSRSFYLGNRIPIQIWTLNWQSVLTSGKLPTETTITYQYVIMILFRKKVNNCIWNGMSICAVMVILQFLYNIAKCKESLKNIGVSLYWHIFWNKKHHEIESDLLRGDRGVENLWFATEKNIFNILQS